MLNIGGFRCFLLFRLIWFFLWHGGANASRAKQAVNRQILLLQNPLLLPVVPQSDPLDKNRVEVATVTGDHRDDMSVA